MSKTNREYSSNYKPRLALRDYIEKGKSCETKASESDSPPKLNTHRSEINIRRKCDSIISFSSPFKSIDEDSLFLRRSKVQEEYFSVTKAIDPNKTQWVDANYSFDIYDGVHQQQVGYQ